MLGAARRCAVRLARLAIDGLRRVRAYEFRDCRLILEQDGDVHYLLLTAASQRRVTRWALGAIGAGLVVFAAMAITSAALSVSNGRLVSSHENIYRALLETYDGKEGESDGLTEEHMLAIASSIRQRNSEIQRFVDRSLASISGENVELSDALRGSGLTEQAIRIIQLSRPVGGYSGDVAPHSNMAEVDELARAIARNRSLRDVLGALPDHLPLDSPGISSGFGLRIHPISGKPQFHTGIDLLPTQNLFIRAVMRGRVVVASRGVELGNVVVLRHAGGIETLYGHMASIAVHAGDDVTESTVLGIVGNTGTASTGRHLHFEVSVGGYPVNPFKVIQIAQNVRKIEARR
jgi:murein DD-endopeptidase MepM/ murein hydrolase activator NlpD